MTKASDTVSGNTPDYIVSGLVEDKHKKKDTLRDQVNKAIATLTVRLPQLPEHQGLDTTPAMENTSTRLENLQKVLTAHFEVE